MRKYEKNNKPAEYFDSIYGTSLAQKYKFPNDLHENAVWEIITLSHNKKGRSDELQDLINKLNYGHFPYMCVEYLSDDVKFNILCGMASCINFDDIVWYSINGVYSYMNIEVNNELNKHIDISKHIGWVVSPKTLEKIKKICVLDY